MNIRKQSTLKSYNDKKNEKLSQLFDIKTLDLYCRYIISSNANIKMASLILVQELFNKVYELDYGNDTERINRIRFIKKGIEARTIKHLTDKDMIIQYINGGINAEPLIDISGYKEISDDELAYINEQSCILSESYFVDGYYNEIAALSNELHSGGLNRANAVNKIKEQIQKLNSTFNRIESAKNIEPEFSLFDDTFENTFRDIFARETSSSRTLKTGLAGLNRMINGGFESGRVYIFFGTAATGKSFFALDLALQLMKYNQNYKPKDPTKKPCVIFLTMENSVQENVSRIFNMITGKVMNTFTEFNEALGLFKDAVKYYCGSEDIDIYMEYQPNLSQSTNYLYALVDKIKANNKEPMCIFIDHIKRIRSIDPAKDMRLDLGNIVNEFKAFANIQDIPIITISHLNREAAKNIGENKNRKDIIRSLGVNNVSDSLLMIDNCDVGIILNKEADSKGNLYMGISSIKTRTKCEVELFFQPYMELHSLKLIEDADAEVPIYKWTLIDKESGPLRMTNNDYIKPSRRIDDDEEMFSSKNLSSDDIVNSNTNVMGIPEISQPQSQQIFDPTFDLQQKIEFVPLPIQNEEQSPWEKELINLKYNTDAKVGMYFTDETGMVIGDGVEMFV